MITVLDLFEYCKSIRCSECKFNSCCYNQYREPYKLHECLANIQKQENEFIEEFNKRCTKE